MRGKTVEVKCKNCRDYFTARVADRKRGWARFCSKRCKAIKQTRDTGRGAPRVSPGGSLSLGDEDYGFIHGACLDDK